jgi:mannose-6-phosphate isomerase-like protein (cupin superfamily)
MLKARRVVTGFDSQGKSVFVSDGAAQRNVMTESLPDLALAEMWATEATPPELPPAAGDPTVSMTSFLPSPGGSRFRLCRFPGLSDRPFDAQAFRTEYARKAPGLAHSMEEEDVGMHTTDTVDYGIVISGAISLELDDGATVDLKQGDCVVQNGTRHAWRNRSTEPCVMAFIMIGAKRG